MKRYSEELWTVPFKDEVTTEDGEHQFAGMIISVRSNFGDNRKRAIRNAVSRLTDYAEYGGEDWYNAPTPDTEDKDEIEERLIATSEVHRSTTEEIFRSNISMSIDHTRSHNRGQYDSYSRYHYPEPEEGASDRGRVESRFKALGLDPRV